MRVMPAMIVGACVLGGTSETGAQEHSDEVQISSASGASVAMHTEGDGWTQAWRVPCDRALSRDAPYRINGPLITSSGTFRLVALFMVPALRVTTLPFKPDDAVAREVVPPPKLPFTVPLLQGTF